MLKPFTTERLTIRQLQVQDASELARISDVPAVSQWMAFMEDGFPLEKAQALIANQKDTKEYFFAVRLPDRTLIGATVSLTALTAPLRSATGSGPITRARVMRLKRFWGRWRILPLILRWLLGQFLPNADLTIPPPSGC